MKKNTAAWYLGRRGELLVELFLLDLGATFVNQNNTDHSLDFLAGFEKTDGSQAIIGIEAKATEQPLGENLSFPIRTQTLERWRRSNLPVLLAVADVKTSRIYFTWASKANPSRSASTRVTLAEATPKARKDLRKEIDQL